MIVQIRIEPETQERIRKLIENGQYKNIHDFVGLAIDNQIQLDLENNALSTQDNSYLLSESQISLKDKTNFNTLDNFDVPQIDINITDEIFFDKNIQFEVYGPGASSLIWIFQNRFFPVKVALQGLSHLINSEKSDAVEFDLWKTYAAEFALDVSSKLYDKFDGKHEANVGLPSAKQKVANKFIKKRNKDILITQKLETSKKRFSDQFIGRIIHKDSKENKLYFSGACFEMGLVTSQGFTDDPLNPKITLTKTGLEFLKLQNPIFEILKNGKTSISDNIFSDQESNFIQENLISRFELEKQIIDSILTLGKQKIKITTIHDIFLNLKRDYAIETFKDEKILHYIMRKYEDKIKDDYDNVTNETTIEWTVNRYLEFQIIATVGRLIELNLIHREYEGREPVYHI